MGLAGTGHGCWLTRGCQPLDAWKVLSSHTQGFFSLKFLCVLLVQAQPGFGCCSTEGKILSFSSQGKDFLLLERRSLPHFLP